MDLTTNFIIVGDAMDIADELYDKYADEISKEAVSNERYLKLKSKLQSVSDEFEKLDNEIKEIVDRYIELSSQENDIYSKAAFHMGFRLGLRIQREMKE